MKPHQLIIPLILLLMPTAFRCKKDMNPCAGLPQPKADFAFKEVLSDTAFYADTIFADNPVNFVALRPYKSLLWKVGSDPRDFTTQDFYLNFPNFLGTIDVQFTGHNDANPFCFAGDSGVYRGIKKLTIVEQVDKATLTMSPLVGKYRGAFNTTPNDIFTVRIDYFDSAKYNSSITGSKNFYWISNIPKGYIDSTSSTATTYPELRNGMYPEMGYKSLTFGDGANILMGRGKGELFGDTLKIYYQHIYNGKKIFIGKRI
jgi:hypothetical protein